MKLQTFIDYLISISVFSTILFFIAFFTLSTFFNNIEKYSIENSLIRALVVSQQLIYYSGSSDLNSIPGLNAGKYNEINFEKLKNFIDKCNNNTKFVNELFSSSDFYLSLDNLKCFSTVGIPTIKRIVVINNQIKVFEVGIKI